MIEREEAARRLEAFALARAAIVAITGGSPMTPNLMAQALAEQIHDHAVRLVEDWRRK